MKIEDLIKDVQERQNGKKFPEYDYVIPIQEGFLHVCHDEHHLKFEVSFDGEIIHGYESITQEMVVDALLDKTK